MKIKIKPLSVNQAWQGKRYKTDKYKAFEKELLLLLPPMKIEFKGDLSVELIYGFSNSLSDVDNPTKPVLDVLQKKYGFNDRQIVELTLKKEIVKKGEEFIELKINEI